MTLDPYDRPAHDEPHPPRRRSPHGRLVDAVASLAFGLLLLVILAIVVLIVLLVVLL